MSKLRDILRLRLEANLSLRQIRDSLRISLGSVQKVINLAESKKISWPSIQLLDDVALATFFYPNSTTTCASKFQLPSWIDIHFELKKKGVTKYLLWEEYSQQYPNHSYSYPQFCTLYMRWFKKQKRSMRQSHKAGEKLFVDYAGQTMPIIHQETGEVRQAQIFVAVLGASNYTYVEATWSQTLQDWINSHCRAFEFLGGVPVAVVPDNLRSGVSYPCRYDPTVNANYQQMAAHYNVAILPARPLKPKDKAKAEVGVQIIERWILARLRHHTFFSLAELNQCILTLLKDVNNKPFKQLKGTRQSIFDEIDKPHLNSLPKHQYQYTDIRKVSVNIDYHVQYQDHLYSVPHRLVGEKLELHATESLIQIYFNHQLMTTQIRKHYQGVTTIPEHMPIGHREHKKWNAARILNWSMEIGEEVTLWIREILKLKQHEEQAYRVCLGLLNLSRHYDPHRINTACGIANKHQFMRLKQVKEILINNQDKLPENQLDTDGKQPSLLPQNHENVRGPESFH